jgi:hypothetical protein
MFHRIISASIKAWIIIGERGVVYNTSEILGNCLLWFERSEVG